MPELKVSRDVDTDDHKKDEQNDGPTQKPLSLQPLIITIDGPAGTGKSTAAFHLARRLGLEFLDTGAMYRAAAVIAKQQNINLDDGQAVANALNNAQIDFDFSTDPPRLRATAPTLTDLTDGLRSPEATAGASRVAACPHVREILVKQQRIIGDNHPRLVTEGRDQGSVVFPDAAVKFYLDASPIARARRRTGQLHAQGKHADLETLEKEIRQRDEADTRRAVGPLRIPEDAIVIDTTDLSENQVFDTLEAHVRSIAGQRLDQAP